MATYPTFSALESRESVNRYRGGIDVEYSANGTPLGRDFGTSRYLDFELIYPAMLDTDFDTLLTFYEANSGVSFTFNSEYTGSSHTCYFSAPPYSEPVSGSRSRVVVKMFEST